MSLLPVEDAQARLLAMATPLPSETVAIGEASGRMLAQDLIARRNQPSADLSAMDGYAVRASDLPGPWRVIGESAAGGASCPPISSGEAARIFTGAPLPQGTDTVIIQEDVARDGNNIRLTDTPPPAGKNVRLAGSDFASGQTLIAAGTQLSPVHIALAAMGGHGSLTVHRRPHVLLLATGSELVPPGAPIGEGQIPSSNSLMLAAMLRAQGCDVTDLGIASDNLESMIATLRDAPRADVIVTIGGASVGDHDLVKPALQAAGGAVDFWKIRMRPGKPLISGRLGDAVFLGLPGNPVSAFVTAHLFLMPLVRTLAGKTEPLPAHATAVIDGVLPPSGKRDEYLRGWVEGGKVRRLAQQDSAALHALSQANCLILRPAEAPGCAPGDEVIVLPI